FAGFLLTVDGVTTQARLRIALAAVVVTGAVVSLLAGLEYLQLAPVLRLLTAFRPGLATVGAQVRAGGSLQYPTIASMYLEIVFAFGLGLLLMELDGERRGGVDSGDADQYRADRVGFRRRSAVLRVVPLARCENGSHRHLRGRPHGVRRAGVARFTRIDGGTRARARPAGPIPSRMG